MPGGWPVGNRRYSRLPVGVTDAADFGGELGDFALFAIFFFRGKRIIAYYSVLTARAGGKAEG